jgi:hypothetical protein
MNVFPEKINVETFEYKPDGDVNRFLIATIIELLAASNAMVAHESGIWR